MVRGYRMKLNLVVIYSQQPEALRDFYAALLRRPFVEEKHDEGPVHYSSSLDDIVFEIFSLKKTSQEERHQEPALGFEVPDLETAVAPEEVQPFVYREPHQREYGRVALLIDPDGRRIILTEKRE